MLGGLYVQICNGGKKVGCTKLSEELFEYLNI